MTSAAVPTEGAGHPELFEISALTEGLLTPERSTDVRSHLAECTVCADTHASLEEIRGALGTLPGPAAMPAEFVSRIDAALAAEALLDATHVSRETDALLPAEPPPHRSGPWTPDDYSDADADAEADEGSRSDVSRETALSAISSRPRGHAPAATGPGRPSRRSRVRRPRWRVTLLGTAAVVAVLGLGTFFVQLIATPTNDSSEPMSVTEERGEHGASSSVDPLEKRVQALLGKRNDTRPPEASQEGGGHEDRLNSPLADAGTSLPACVQDALSRTEKPLAVDQQVFQGTQVYLVVLPHSADPQRVDAYLVDAGCTKKAADEPGAVLSTGTYQNS